MTGTVITTKGRALIAKLIALESPLEFTRAAVGTGSVPGGYDPAGMNDLNHYQMDGNITEAAAADDVANVTFQVASQEVEEGFLMTEAGLFAKDPDEGEILYAYLDLSKDPQYIYKKGEEINKVAEITLGVIIGRIEKVTTTVSPAGLVTKEVFDRTVEALEGRMDAAGRVLVGAAGTELENNDTLFVVEGEMQRQA